MWKIIFIHFIVHATVYIQIFKACKFRGCHKSSIFAILFSSILLSDSCKSKFANEISRMKISRMASSLWKPQKLHPLKICTYTVYLTRVSLLYMSHLLCVQERSVAYHRVRVGVCVLPYCYFQTSKGVAEVQ